MVEAAFRLLGLSRSPDLLMVIMNAIRRHRAIYRRDSIYSNLCPRVKRVSAGSLRARRRNQTASP